MTLPEYDAHINQHASELGVNVEIFHFNIEGEVINKFYEAHDGNVDEVSEIARGSQGVVTGFGVFDDYLALRGILNSLKNQGQVQTSVIPI